MSKDLKIVKIESVESSDNFAYVAFNDQDQSQSSNSDGGDHALTYWKGVITNLAVIIGAGIGVMPNAMYKLGIVPGIVVILLACCQTINQAWLYLKTKDMIPGNPESFFEIGFYLMGRKFIFVISGIICLLSYGETAARLNVVGHILSSLLTICEINPIYTHISFTVFCVGVFVLPICLKKEMQEMYIFALGLFITLCIFTFFMFLQVTTHHSEFASSADKLIFAEMIWPPQENSYLKIINAVLLILFSFSFSENLFPLFSGLKEKTNQNCINIMYGTTVFSTIAYISISIFGLILFGRGVSVDANIMINIQNENALEAHWDSILLQILFLIIQVCNIPTGFFPGKEALLIIIDEIHRKSISSSLTQRIEDLNSESRDLTMKKAQSYEPAYKSLGVKIKDQSKTQVVGQQSFQTKLRSAIQVKYDTKITRIRETQTLRKTQILSDEFQSASEDSQENKLAYKDMSDLIYYPVTILSIFALGVLACIIPNVEVVITFISGICVTFISFFLPAIFFLLSSKESGVNIFKISAYIQLFLGIFVFLGSIVDSVDQLNEIFG